MSVNPNSVRQIVQAVNIEIEANHGVLNQKTESVVRTALDKISELPAMNSKDSIALVDLASRISNLSQSEGALPADCLSQVFFDKAKEAIMKPALEGDLLIKSKNKKIFSLVMPFIKKSMSTTEVLDILNNVAAIPWEDAKSVCQAISLIKEEMNYDDTINVLKIMTQIPKKERAGFSFVVDLVIRQGMMRPVGHCILEAAAGCSKEKQVEFVCDAVVFIKNLVSFESQIKHYLVFGVNSILRQLVVLPHDERESLYNAYRFIIRKQMNSNEVAGVLSAIVKIPLEERLSVSRDSAGFFNQSTTAKEIAVILDAVSGIPEANRESVFRDSSRFFNQRTTAKEIAVILDAVAGIPEANRESVFRDSDRIFNARMGNEGRAIILTAVAAIPEEDREFVFSLAETFVKKTTEAYEMVSILGVLANIPKEKVDIVCGDADKFFREDMDLSEKASILKAVAEISQEKREFVFSLVSYLPIDVAHGSEIVAWLSKIQEIPIQNEAKISQSLQKAEEYGNQRLGGFLKFQLIQNGKSIEYGESLALLAEPSLVSHKILPSILPAKWIADIKKENPAFGKDNQEVSDLIRFLNTSKSALKDVDSRLVQPYLFVAIALDSIPALTSLRKLQLLSKICLAEENMKCFALILAIFARKEDEALVELSLEKPIDSLTVAFKESFGRDTFIDLSGIEDSLDKYVAAFADTRIPFSIEIYALGIRNLNEESVSKSLERMIRSILLGTFEAERYDTTKSPHLKRIQDYDEQKGKTILEQWKNLSFKADVLSEAVSTQENKFSFKDFFEQKLGDGHAIKNEIDQLPRLSSFFKTDPEARPALLNQLGLMIQASQDSVKTESNLEEKKKIAENLKILQAEKSCMELVLNVDLSEEQQIKKIRGLSASLSHLKLELIADLEGLVRILKAEGKSSTPETVEFCKGWEDLFLSGSEVEGSCQRIDGNHNVNKCLLAYCLDGKNAMVAVKDANQKLLARSMLRLLWDQTENKPVLFLDRLYPYPCSNERGLAIQKASLEIARDLDLELFISGGVDAGSSRIIESLGSSCPYEYADGSDGVMPNGIFTITNAQKIEGF